MEELDVLASGAMKLIIVVIILGVMMASALDMFLLWGPDSEYCEYTCLSDPATTGAWPNKSRRRPSAARKEIPVSVVDPVDGRSRQYPLAAGKEIPVSVGDPVDRRSRRCPLAAGKEIPVSVVDPVDGRARADAGRDGPSGNVTEETKDRGHGFVDDDNDGWELVERSQLPGDFEKAVKFVDGQTAAGVVALSEDEKSRLEGLINVAAEWLPARAATNRNAGGGWLEAMSPEDAMSKYVDRVREKFPNWREGGC